MDFFDYFYHNVFRNEFKTQECEAGSATHSLRAGKMIKKGERSHDQLPGVQGWHQRGQEG